MHLRSTNGWKVHTVVFLFSSIPLTLTACNSTPGAPGRVLGQDQMSGPPAQIPPSLTPNPPDTATPDPSLTPLPNPTSVTVGPSCTGNGKDQFCLALKYVVYTDSKGSTVVNQGQAIKNLNEMNNLWRPCGIQFQMDQFVAANPADFGLRFNTANYPELDDIRETFEDPITLLVVTTGSWNRYGSLGSTGANAWTMMPGNDRYGAILEEDVGTFSNIIAHEIGHYLNLDHVNDSSNLMNPVIYDNSTVLSRPQCQEARNAIDYYWRKMIR